MASSKTLYRQAVAFACNEDFFTYTGLKEFKDLLDESPSHAKEYITLATKTESFSKESWAYTSWATEKRCWVRLRLEEWMEDSDGEFDRKIVDAFFKNEKVGVSGKAQFEANKEAFLTEEGITTLWIIFANDVEAAGNYVKMTRGMGFHGHERVMERMGYIRELLEEWIHGINSPGFAQEENTDIYFDKKEMKMYRVKDGAIQLAKKEMFLTEEGVEDFSNLLWDADEKSAEAYIDLVEKHAKKGGYPESKVAERAIFVRVMMKKWLKDNDWDADKIFTYFKTETNASHQPAITKAGRLLNHERKRKGSPWDVRLTGNAYYKFLPMLQGSQELAKDYIRIVEAGYTSLVQIEWLKARWEELNEDGDGEML